MKKYAMFVFVLALVFGFFNTNITSAGNSVNYGGASVVSPASSSSGCKSGDLFSRTTGERCNITLHTECKPGDLFSSLTGQPCTSITSTTTINSSVVFTRELSAKLKSTGNDVLKLQQFLKDEGYLFGKVDGKFGKITGRAVGDLQEDNDMDRTEAVDAATKALLNTLVKGTVETTKYTGPVISGVSGPQELAVNQTGTWTVKASSKDGEKLIYSVDWGDQPVDQMYTSNSRSISPGQQSATFTHSYLQAGTYTPTFTVQNSSGRNPAKTSLTVNVGKISSTIISEQVKCVFSGSTTEQSCYATNRDGKQYTFKGRETAGGTVSGYKGEVLTWKSSCGSYAYTTMDNDNDSAKFNCSTITEGFSIITPSELPNATAGLNYITAFKVTGASSTSTNNMHWSVVDGNLPTGMYLSPSDYGMVLTGTPAWEGYYGFTLQVSLTSPYTASTTATKEFRLKVNNKEVVLPNPKIISILQPGCRLNTGYSSADGEACSGLRSSANFGETVYVYGSGFGDDTYDYGIYLVTYSSTTGDLVKMIPTVYSSSLLSFIVSANAGTGQHSIAIKKSNEDSFLSNSVILYLYDKVTSPTPIPTPTPTPIPTIDRKPVGYLDEANCDIIGGWAYDPDIPSDPINIHLYDGGAGAGKFIQTVTTAGIRTDVNASYGITGTHGFTITTPSYLKDGQNHSIYGYAINNNGDNPDLASSPRTINCSPKLGLSSSVISAVYTPEIPVQAGNVGAGKFHFTQFLSEGSYGNEVVELQKYLNNAGYNAGKIDGIFGANLKASLLNFQTENKMKSDGIVGFEVRSFLNR